MAAFSEIRNVEDFEWDEVRGGSFGDAGQGPARQGAFAWVRTGFAAAFSSASPGQANCDGYTASASVWGSGIIVDHSWTATSAQDGSFPGWEYRAMPCNSPIPVWCMQD